MIKLPIKALSSQGNEDLAILCKALFIEIEDNRLMALLWPEAVENRMTSLMESPLCESLYEMVHLFGEGDFIKFVTPALNDLAKEDCTDANFLTRFEKHFKGIM